MKRDDPRSIDALRATSQFAALEPIWAGISSTMQLRALLVFGALFNERVYVHDTQLVDNPRVVGDFSRSDLRENNFYRLLRQLIAAGVVAVGLRSHNYLYREDRLDACDSLAEVLESWKRNSPDGKGWVISPISVARNEMIEELDGILTGDGPVVVRYDYVSAKDDFMRQVRDAANSPDSVLTALLSAQPIELRRRYDKILARPRFSHTPIFALLHESGLPVSSELIQIHGLFDETAHARAFNARIMGSDWNSEDGTGLAEAVLTDGRLERGQPGARLDPEELVETAYRMVEGPPPDLLAMLRFEEIVELREQARELFEIQSYLEVSDARDVDDALATALADCAADYWQRVCDHIRATRPHLTVRPTRLGIFLRGKMPRLAKVAERFAVSGLSTLTEVAINAVPLVGGMMGEGTKSSVLRRANIEFVFFADSARMRDLRNFYPHRNWISSDARSITSR
ncbi:hypothetical protein ACFFV7_09115 [Nonomuraea spiralis]|uniref:Uncharacterized protein n=1 Tax=Nonomuraea spiralis TaxID=46182 RepID=A0ABV5I9Y2_9ACTN|nr:hypothetical protein [Nonomuraea spiralis]GGT05771.1 hypothetical protein GCM10010176_057620 [Nonomuraea spiralis]